MLFPPAPASVLDSVPRKLAARLLIGAEDRVLLQSMARIVSWSRPSWTVETVVGAEGVRRALGERAFDVLVVVVEPRSSSGGAMLKSARLNHDHVARVAYRTSESCDGQEIRMASEIVSWPADIHALLAALDGVVVRLVVRADPSYAQVTVPAPPLAGL